jgi:hypothetical protein
MAFDTHQFSTVAPAIAWLPNANQEEGAYAMLFKSKDSTNRLLYIGSDDGINWNPEIVTGQYTKAAPAVVVTDHSKRLFAVFIANDPSNRVLYGEIKYMEGNFTIPQISETGETGIAVAAAFEILNDKFIVYFVSNDPTRRLLGREITP